MSERQTESNPRKIEINPYASRGPVLKPEEFFGRQRLLEDIYKRILGGQSVSLVGERRTGKSSLLNAVRFEREEFDLPDEFHFVFLDLQSLAGCTEQFFLEFLIGIVAEEAELHPEGTGRRTLWEMGLELKSRDKRLVVLLDELDALTENKEISTDMFAFLRSWSVQSGVALVVAFREGSIDQVVERESAGSLFLNLFGSVYVGPMEKLEAEDLIKEPALSCGVRFTEEEIQEIVALAGYLPLFLKIASYHMFELRQSMRIRSDWREELEDRFAAEATQHFSYLWGRLSEPEQSLLRQPLADARGADSNDAAKMLRRKGLIISDQETARVFSRAFESFVARHPGSTKTTGFGDALKKSLFG